VTTAGAPGDGTTTRPATGATGPAAEEDDR